MKTSTLTIRLPKEQREALKRSAKALKKTESEYIRDLLARDLDTRTIDERIGHLAGILDSSKARRVRDDSFRETIRKHNWRTAWEEVPRMLVPVDTGPLVAYLDRGDPAHDFVRARWEAMPGRFVTTGAVLTEAMHFLSPLQNGPQKLLEFLKDGTLLLQDTFRMALLDRAGALMEQYADIPMHFADATLVVLAEEVQTPRIVTLDDEVSAHSATAGISRFGCCFRTRENRDR